MHFPPAETTPGGEVVEHGLFMDHPLTVHHILWRMKNVNGSSTVTSLTDSDEGTCSSLSFSQLVDRAAQLASALARLGVRPGDRVASLAWNDTEHLETYFGVMGMGGVLHTMNHRLTDEQLVYTVNHAEDKVIIVDGTLAEQLSALLPLLKTVEVVVVIDRPGSTSAEIAGSRDYEELLAAEDPDFAWPSLDERAAASLCFTSGTTGDPKGVLYSHRSIVLHALVMAGADAYGIRREDRVLAIVPLSHAMGWGLPFMCGLSGADLVLPGNQPRPQALTDLIQGQAVTWSAGVPTVWLDILNHVNDLTGSGRSADFSTLTTVVCGGAAIPESLMKQYEEQFGVAMIPGWGMTEVFPGATIGRDRSGDSTDEKWRRRQMAGRVSPTYEVRVVDSDGTVVPHDGASVGEIQIKGPAVANSYFRAPKESLDKFAEGWLRTGDVGTIDQDGWMTISDRVKDLIKSGGEWISPSELEAALMSHPRVREVAVVGRPDARWSERPVAFVVVREGTDVGELHEFLQARFPKWWLPDEFFLVQEIPRSSTGKLDKKVLRSRVAEST